MNCNSCSWALEADATLIVGLKGTSVAQSAWSQSSWRERAGTTGDWEKENNVNITEAAKGKMNES